MKIDPTTREGFERIGDIVNTLEGFGSGRAGRLLSRFVSVEKSVPVTGKLTPSGPWNRQSQ